MKKILFSILSGAMMLLGSCSTDNAEPTAQGDATTFSITLDGTESRATTDAGAKRYIMEIFNEDGSPANLLDGKNHKEVAEGSFTVTLDKTKAYTCLFWADGSEANDNAGVFDAASLKAVKLNADKHATDAFYAKVSVEKGKNAAVAVTLKRAVAKITLVETAGVEVGKKLTVSCSQPTTYDVSTGLTGDAKVIGSETTTAVNRDKIYEFRMLATIDGETTDVTFTYNAEKAKTITTVPVKQNFNTNLKGEFSNLTTGTFNITTDSNWGDPDFDSALAYDGPYAWYINGKDKGEFKIESIEQLKQLADIVNNNLANAPAGMKTDDFEGKTIILDSDLDLKNEEWMPIGRYFEGNYYKFKGTFDGNGKTISNLKITEGNHRYNGLFGYVFDGVVKNITITNVDIIANDSDGCSSGAASGYAYNSLFSNVTVIGNINIKAETVLGKEVRAGVISGNNVQGAVINCAAIPTSVGTHVIAIGDAVSRAGGLVGDMNNYGGMVVNSISTANVSITHLGANQYVCAGGLVGYGLNTSANCIASGDIESTAEAVYSFSRVGGFSGYTSLGADYGLLMVDNCFALNDKVTIKGGGNSNFIGKVVGSSDYVMTYTVNAYANSAMDYTLDGVKDAFNSGDVTYNGTDFTAVAASPWWNTPAGKSIVESLNDYVTANPTATWNGNTVTLKKWKTGTSKKCPAVFVD